MVGPHLIEYLKNLWRFFHSPELPLECTLKWRVSFFLLVSIAVFEANRPALPASAGDVYAKRQYKAMRINSSAPEVDGVLNDPIWRKAAKAQGFVQIMPHEGQPASEKTFFQIVYDDHNLYVGIYAFDLSPDDIVGRTTRRDDISESDMVGVFIDSYSDKRTAFEFSVNPVGVKKDVIHSDGGEIEDPSWEPVWFVATSKNDLGWFAEMRIPFSQLRYANHREHTWGIEIYRYIFRRQELSGWQFIPHNAPLMVPLFGELLGLKNITAPLRLELLPYSVASRHTYKTGSANGPVKELDNFLSGGLDGKIALSSDMTLDFAINPDFGQVEADPSEVNLTAFETFFEEKRPFFIEGKNIFSYPLTNTSLDASQEQIYYSRRIGRAPQYSPTVQSNYSLNVPATTSILGALKLTGKTAHGYSFAILDAVTAEEKALLSAGQTHQDITVEPLANFFVGRLQKDLHQGGTTFGGIFTGTHRDISSPNLLFLNKEAYAGGVDLSHTWHNREYKFDFSASLSQIAGDKQALLEAQTSSARYFQRPDASHLDLDSSRTSLSGNGGYIGIGKIGGGHWRYFLGGYWRTPGFELNDIGYLRRADQIMQLAHIGYDYWTPIGLARRLLINIDQWAGWNFGREKIFGEQHINFMLQFLSYHWLGMGITRNDEQLSPYFLRGGPAFLLPSSWSNWIQFYSDSRYALSASLSLVNYWRETDSSETHTLRASMLWRPGSRISLSVQPLFSWKNDPLQYVATVSPDNQSRYIFAAIQQKTLGIVFRLNYSITSNFSIQFYGQPFISTGQYSRYKRITNPRAKDYAGRFKSYDPLEIDLNSTGNAIHIDENVDGITDFSIGNPDFNFRQFRSNLVIRWEYLPGSTLYFVWSQGRTGLEYPDGFSAIDDMNALFHLYPENVFLLKMNYWLSF
ncbi:hypothetical protein A2V82_09680 [candidate division KSB1 bacterium RBG_16_48_16]|nr:MAG: hypothetical protein A2V82_09680 [candidate division KSB1 bacterium RBG_16_48_16]